LETRILCLQNQMMRYDNDANRSMKKQSTIIKSISLLATIVLLIVLGYDLNWVYPAEHDQQNEKWREEIVDLRTSTIDEPISQSPTDLSDSDRLGEVAGVVVDLDKSTIDSEKPTVDLSQLDQVKLIKVVDGDTIKVDLDGQIENVRLVSVDAPESVAPGQPVGCMGKESADFLQSLLIDQSTLYLQNDETQSNRDRYGRLLRFVFLSDGKDAGLELLKTGLAEAKLYSRQPHQYWSVYQEAEAGAKSQELGIWSKESCPTPPPPLP